MNEFDEDASVSNGHYEVDVVIDAPVSQVWKQFLDIGSWVTSHTIENVSGEPGTLGSITRVAFKKAKESGLPPAHYHFCKIIKLIPEQQYVLKTYSEKGGSYGVEISAFDDTRFVEADGKTTVTFNLYATSKSGAPLDLEVSRQGMVQNLAKLKGLVENV